MKPGLVLVRPDGTLYAALVGSMPFARPHFSEVLKALDFIVEKDYPAAAPANTLPVSPSGAPRRRKPGQNWR